MKSKQYQGQTGNIVNRKTLKRELRAFQRGGSQPGSGMTHAAARSLFANMGWAVNVRA